MKSTMTEDNEGNKEWLNEKGLYHREDGPAFISDERKEWYIDGRPHREDGPAIETKDPEDENEWYINGKLHREDGPAVECIGYKSWHLNGKQHRLNGPAVEWNNEDYLQDPECCPDDEWYIDDIKYTEKQHKARSRFYKLKNILD